MGGWIYRCSFPLCDQTVASGATEYWPGSHRDLGLIHGDADPNGRYPTAKMIEDFEVSYHTWRLMLLGLSELFTSAF